MKFLIIIYIFLLPLSMYGQSSYYLAAQTTIRYRIDPNDVEWQEVEKYKFESKYDTNGYNRLSASYYWDCKDVENPNPSPENNWIAICKCDWTGDSKAEYLNKGLHIFYEWNYDIDDWMEVKKNERKHDSNGNELSCIVYNKEKKVGQWMPSYKTEDEYNNYNRGILHIDYQWNKELNNWSAYYKYEDEYDDGGMRILWISYTWNKLLNDWESTSKATFMNDVKGRLIQQVNYIKKGSGWMRTTKTEQKYNKNGDVHIFYDWKQNTNKWVKRERIETKKEEKTNLTTSRHWDSTLNKYIENVKSEYQYNAQEKEVLSVSYQWNSVENQWIQVSKLETTYDEQGNPINTNSYVWRQEEWILSQTNENIYAKKE